jgi:hypothetical protein
MVHHVSDSIKAFSLIGLFVVALSSSVGKKKRAKALADVATKTAEITDIETILIEAVRPYLSGAWRRQRKAIALNGRAALKRKACPELVANVRKLFKRDAPWHVYRTVMMKHRFYRWMAEPSGNKSFRNISGMTSLATCHKR